MAVSGYQTCLRLPNRLPLCLVPHWFFVAPKVEAAYRKKAEQLGVDLARAVFIYVVWVKKHWTCAVARLSNRTVLYYDSKGKRWRLYGAGERGGGLLGWWLTGAGSYHR